MTASRRRSGHDGIVPLRVEFVARDIEGVHLGVADLDPLRVGTRIKLAAYLQTGLRGRRGDQFDHGEPTGQRLAAPGLGNMAEQAVLDPRLRGDKPCSTLMSQAESGRPEASG